MHKKSCLLNSALTTIPPCVISLSAPGEYVKNTKYVNPWGVIAAGEERYHGSYFVYVSDACGKIQRISCNPNSASISSDSTCVIVDSGNSAGHDNFSLICYCQNATVQINATVANFT